MAVRDQTVVRLFPNKQLPLPMPAAEAHVRIVEALLFASTGPVSEEELRQRLPLDADVRAALGALEEAYAGRGVNLVAVAGKWAFRTAPDLGHLMVQTEVEQKKLSRAALETLAIIAYHQPVTRAEIEEVRGVAIGRGTLDILIEIGWVRLRGRRKSPGRPVTYGTTEAFLIHFGLDQVSDLPGVEELIGAGLLDRNALIVPATDDEDLLAELPDMDEQLDLPDEPDEMDASRGRSLP